MPGRPADTALEQVIIGKAVDLLSGPGGLASFLRRRQLGARLGAPSLPLDVGYGENVPAGIRNAVRLRDQHCRWSGGCLQPAAACEIHHVKHKARGGKTSVKDCVLLCFFHHHVMIHRMGWTLVLHPDGTTTAHPPAPGNPPAPMPAQAAQRDGHHQACRSGLSKPRWQPRSFPPEPHRMTTPPRSQGVVSGAPDCPGPRAGSPLLDRRPWDAETPVCGRWCIAARGYAQPVTCRACSRNAKVL